MRMRKIKKGFEELKRDDPATALTESGLRKLVISGKIHAVKFGRDWLFDLDSLEGYLLGNQSSPEPVRSSVIRRLPERL